MKNLKKTKISNAFKEAIVSYSQRKGIAHYQIAAKANITPNILSYMLNDTMLFYPDDPRVKRIAKIINFKKECFAK